MYVGRIVAVGRTSNGQLVTTYRVSSRSFPNRSAEQLGAAVRIVPRAGSPDASSDSPYISYECLVCNDRFAVASNGTQTRPIFERLRAGYSPRDSLGSVLAGLDREFDAYDTPRIVGVFDVITNEIWLGSVTAVSLVVTPVRVDPGMLAFICTYQFPLPLPGQVDSTFTVSDAQGACRHITQSSVFADFEKPICAAAVKAGDTGMEIATLNIPADAN